MPAEPHSGLAMLFPDPSKERNSPAVAAIKHENATTATAPANFMLGGGTAPFIARRSEREGEGERERETGLGGRSAQLKQQREGIGEADGSRGIFNVGKTREGQKKKSDNKTLECSSTSAMGCYGAVCSLSPAAISLFPSVLPFSRRAWARPIRTLPLLAASDEAGPCTCGIGAGAQYI